MNLPVVLSPDAEREFDLAADWYQQRAGRGVQFVYGVVHRDVRCARVRRFPYNIFYRFNHDRVEVIAILHGHRNPSIWKARS